MKRRAAAASAFWSALLFWARFGINSAVFLVIARWLSVGEIGAYGSAFALVQIVQAAQTSGFSDAIVQKADDRRAATTAFWLSLGFGIAASLALVFAAPLIGTAFHAPRAADFTLYLAAAPMFTGLGAVSEGLIRKRMDMRLLALRTTIALTVAGAVAIAIAWHGRGGWALVALTLTNSGLAAAMNLGMARWRPELTFDKAEAKALAAMALQIGARNVVKSSINPVAQLIIAATLGVAASGVYVISVRIAGMLYSVAMLPVEYAALPLFAKLDDGARKREGFLEAAGLTSLVTSPIYLGAFAMAPWILDYILGRNGAASAPVAQGLLFHSPVLVVFNLAVPMLVAVKKASSAFKITLVQAIANIPLVWLAAQFSVVWVGWSFGVLYYLLLPAMLTALHRHAGIAPRKVMAEVLRPWIAALLMAAATWTAMRALPVETAAAYRLVVGAGTGIVSYVALSLLIALPQWRLAWKTARSLTGARLGGG